jgi:hypothetical protein
MGPKSKEGKFSRTETRPQAVSARNRILGLKKNNPECRSTKCRQKENKSNLEEELIGGKRLYKGTLVVFRWRGSA